MLLKSNAIMGYAKFTAYFTQQPSLKWIAIGTIFFTINSGLLLGQSFLSRQVEYPELEAPPHPLMKDIEQENAIELRLVRYLTEDFFDSVREILEAGEVELALNTLLKQPIAFEDDLDDDDKSSLLAERERFLLQLYYLSGRYVDVVLTGRRYFPKFKAGSDSYQAYYLFASALNRLNRTLEYTSLVSKELLDDLPSEKAKQLRLYLLQDALEQNQVEKAFSYFKQLDTDETIVKQWLHKIIQQISTREQIGKLLEIYDDPGVSSKLYLKEADLLINNGHYQEAADYLLRLANSDKLKVDYYSELLALQKFLQTALKTKPYKIGVILPFTHRNRRFRFLANQVKDGLELALQNLKFKGDNPIQLVFKDSTPPHRDKTSRSKSIITRQYMKFLVKELIEQDNVIAILGPLSKNTSLAVGEAIEPYRTPAISFSLTENIGENFPYLFRFQRSRSGEVKTLVDYAVDYLGAKRFVLLYPANKSGFNSMEAFNDAVIERGGKVVGIARVLRKQVDFQNMFMDLTGGNNKISFKEREELRLTRERLIPVIDFDAIYSPFPPDKLNIIASFLDLFGAEKTWILGDSTANVKENQVIKYSKRLVFVDTFSISKVRASLWSFYENHWSYFNFRESYIEPTAYTFYGYEALELLIKLLNNPQNQTGITLKKSLTNLHSFPLLTGKVSQGKNGELKKEVKLLRIKGRKTVPIFGKTGS